eukprot:GHVP01030923.1.p1 GENE.GHVP01030923.1~~GHVP01030923.1.p1  ORF type:complete len:292 (+),score=89.67 GHVP01030923.1:16-891(+)
MFKSRAKHSEALNAALVSAISGNFVKNDMMQSHLSEEPHLPEDPSGKKWETFRQQIDEQEESKITTPNQNASNSKLEDEKPEKLEESKITTSDQISSDSKDEDAKQGDFKETKIATGDASVSNGEDAKSCSKPKRELEEETLEEDTNNAMNSVAENFYEVIVPEYREAMKELIEENDLFMFSSTQCKFCHILREILDKEDFPYTYMELDESVRDEQDPVLAMYAVRLSLEELTGGMQTVPAVFVKGKFFGDANKTVEAIKSGELKKLLTGTEDDKVENSPKELKDDEVEKA